jgi:hypothetical protein
LFESTYGGYDVAPDGKRFLMIKNVAAASAGDADRLNIIVNWRDELKARVPTK